MLERIRSFERVWGKIQLIFCVLMAVALFVIALPAMSYNSARITPTLAIVFGLLALSFATFRSLNKADEQAARRSKLFGTLWLLPLFLSGIWITGAVDNLLFEVIIVAIMITALLNLIFEFSTDSKNFGATDMSDSILLKDNDER